MTGVLQALLRRAELTPDHLQFTFPKDGGGVTARQVAEAAACFAGLFADAGAKPGDVVLIALPTGPDAPAAFLGALWQGCIPSFMPLPSAKQHAELFWRSHDTLFHHLNGGLILTGEDNRVALQDNITPGLLRIVCPTDATGGPPGVPFEWRGGDICCLQHSSGTTGLKKGVTLTFDAIRQQIRSYTAAANVAPGDTIASWLPLYHDMGFITSLLLPLIGGNHSVMVSPFDWLGNPPILFDMIEQYDARFVWLPNFAFQHLARTADDKNRRRLSGMKALVNCSEPCRPETVERFVRRFRSWGIRPDQLQVSYGMAEAVFAITQTRGSPVRSMSWEGRRVSSVGRPIEGLELRMSDGTSGEILVRGEFVFDGYYRQAVSPVAPDGWYATGDLGFVDDGELFVLGRRRDLIISLGRNLYAHELESLVGEVAGVKPGRCVAVGVYNEELSSEDVVVIAEADGTVDADIMRSAIRAKLDSTLSLTPRRILVEAIGWLVKSTSGKISRSENLAKYLRLNSKDSMAA